jgi:hypothetical protein
VGQDEILRGGWAPPQGRLAIGPQARNLPHGLKDVKIACHRRADSAYTGGRQGGPMASKGWHALILLALAGSLLGQQPKAQSKPGTIASGVFVGRSGTPMAGARLMLCDVVEDQDSFRGKARLLSNVPIATADKTGRFEFRGFAPGRYTIIYLPAGVEAAVPSTITISPLEAFDKSIAPLLRNFELGTSTAYPPRPWGPFTLLKGHTLYSTGPQMRVWNATARYGQQGPFLEMRRGVIWLQELADKSEFKFDAWSY